MTTRELVDAFDRTRQKIRAVPLDFEQRKYAEIDLGLLEQALADYTRPKPVEPPHVARVPDAPKGKKK